MRVIDCVDSPPQFFGVIAIIIGVLLLQELCASLIVVDDTNDSTAIESYDDAHQKPPTQQTH